jgi:hypothetical protein
MSEPQQPDEPAFTVLDRLVPNILAVHLKQVECAEDGAAVATMTADQVEHRHPAVVTDDRLGIDHTQFDRQRQYRRGCQREAIGQVNAIAGQEPNGARLAVRQDAKAVVLDLVIQPGADGVAAASRGRHGAKRVVGRSARTRRCSSYITDGIASKDSQGRSRVESLSLERIHRPDDAPFAFLHGNAARRQADGVCCIVVASARPFAQFFDGGVDHLSVIGSARWANGIIGLAPQRIDDARDIGRAIRRTLGSAALQEFIAIDRRRGAWPENQHNGRRKSQRGMGDHSSQGTEVTA